MRLRSSKKGLGLKAMVGVILALALFFMILGFMRMWSDPDRYETKNLKKQFSGDAFVPYGSDEACAYAVPASEKSKLKCDEMRQVNCIVDGKKMVFVYCPRSNVKVDAESEEVTS